MVNHIAIHYCLSVCNEEMAAVSEGIDILGLKNIIACHPEGNTELVRCIAPTAEDVFSLLNIENVIYSEDSEKKKKETDVIFNVKEFC